MPSDKRQRQEEGRLARLEEQRQVDRRGQRKRQVRGLALLLAALVAVAFAISVFSSDDSSKVSSEGSTSSTDPNSTSTSADGSSTTASTELPSAADAAIGTTPCPPADGAKERTTTFDSGPQACIDPTKEYRAEVQTSRGTFNVELYAARAPKAVNSFVFLARNRYYEGVAFHRIIPGFVVQGGDANGNPPGTGGPGYSFADELPSGEAPSYEIGSLAMANSGADTNGSQFFVVTGDQGVNLPANFSLFGKVLDGMDVVQAIEATGSAEGTPSEQTTITKVTITES